MKKRLAKAVLMSLVCVNTFACSVEAAQEILIEDNGSNTVVVNGSDTVYVKDISTSIRNEYDSDSESSIKQFSIGDDVADNVTINLVKRNDRHSVNSYATLVNKANTTVNGNLTIHQDAFEQKAIDNSGNIKFNDEVRFTSQIYNSSTGRFVSDGYLHGIILYNDSNQRTVKSYGNIKNEGVMEILGSYKLDTPFIGSGNDIGIVVIDNSGTLKVDSKESSYIDGAIKNSGSLDIVVNGNDEFYSYQIENTSGNFRLVNNDGIVGITHIVNSGELSIVSESISRDGMFIGDIQHNSGATTNIKLGNDGLSEEHFDLLHGTITGSNNGGFKLVLEKNGELWTMDGEHGSQQVEPISGIELNGGKIAFSDNYFVPSDGAYFWFEKYNTLTLNDFSSNGKFGTIDLDNHGDLVSGGIYLFTDLAENKGDKVVFTGTTPSQVVPLGIYNKNDNNGIPIVREDGHSVTIIEAPSDTKMQFKTNLVVYGTPSEEFIDLHGDNYDSDFTDLVDCCNYKVYKAQIDEFIEGNTKYWNFVGWEETGANRGGEDILPQQFDGTDIIQIDTDNTFKRMNELRRDIRTDPSEVGVWMRGETGQTKIGTYSYDYNLMSGGYDWHKENEAGILFTGVGFSYAINDCDDAVVGDTKSYGVNLYGSWYGKAKNEYVDLVLRYGQLDKEYAGLDRNGVFVSGEYDKDMFSVAAKYGRRIYKDDWYWEPSVGFTWGKVGSADFVDNLGTNIHADSTNSMIASLGMQVGKNIKGIEYYCKAEVMHDFDGNIRVTAPGLLAEDDMGGTWLKCAIGASRKVSENNSFYLEVERDFGNKVEKPYGLSLGYRFTW